MQIIKCMTYVLYQISLFQLFFDKYGENFIDVR